MPESVPGAASGGADTTALPEVAPPPTGGSGISFSTEQELAQWFGDRYTHGGGKGRPDEAIAYVTEQRNLAIMAEKSGKCQAATEQCALQNRLKMMLVGPEKVGPATKSQSSPADSFRTTWLGGLKLPTDLPVQDEPAVRKWFEYYSKNSVGREQLTQYLFRCGAYRATIESTLIKYGVPTGLFAVVFAESGCMPLAKSRVGAKGLWQFMPALARAYHLHVVEDVVDERNNPAKLTEAAVRFLSDLYRTFGSWELVFAAYNMGPYGVASRMKRMGGNPTFWDLAATEGMIPDETADYVPRIEAISVILANQKRLRFPGETSMPESSSALAVRPGTPLGQVARAASTSVVRLRQLNLDILGDSVPAIPGEYFSVQVPAEVAFQAEDVLKELIRTDSKDYLCVEPTFDWGRQRFTPEMRSRCSSRLGNSPSPAVAPPSE